MPPVALENRLNGQRILDMGYTSYLNAFGINQLMLSNLLLCCTQACHVQNESWVAAVASTKKFETLCVIQGKGGAYWRKLANVRCVFNRTVSTGYPHRIMGVNGKQRKYR